MDSSPEVIEELRGLIPGLPSDSDWVPHIAASNPLHLKASLARRRVSTLVDLSFAAIRRKSELESVNWIALSMFCYPDRTVDEIRRRGIFRSSKYRFHDACLKQVVDRLIDQCPALSTPESTTHYLRSVSNLLRISKSVRDLDQSLRDFVVRRRSSVLKSVVALVDSLFMLDHRSDLSKSSEDWKFYSKEELAEAGSYVIHCFDEEIGISDEQFNLLDEKALSHGLYHGVLVKACKVRCFLEAEILLDAFEYECLYRRGTATIKPPFPDFEKSVRLGYIQTQQADQRRQVSQTIAARQGQASIFLAAEDFYARFRDQIVSMVEWPLRRYVFAFPGFPEFQEFFRSESVFVEEAHYIQSILDAELVTWEELKRFEIADGVSVLDLMKVFRLFVFIKEVARRHLESVFDQEPELAYRSLVPVFAEFQLIDLLEWCLPGSTIQAVAQMLSWSHGAEGIVDLQYRPFLKGDRLYLTPLNIAGNVNWYRNLAYTQKRRAIDVAEEEAASRALSTALERVTSYVRQGFSTVLAGKTIEIDAVSRFGDYLFIFECKHALHPCNPHEMRTTYEHLKKGAETLSTIQGLLSDKATETELYKRLGWSVEPAVAVTSCIVSCNGMFPGLTIAGHPVRRWPELKNMIESGIVRAGSVRVVNGPDGPSLDETDLVERSLWNGPGLTPDFLREYITGGKVQERLFAPMIPWEREFRLNTSLLVFDTFLLDLEAARRDIEQLPH